MNICQTKTLERFLSMAEVLRMMLERPDWYAAASNERAENQCSQTAADFEYGTARVQRKTRDLLKVSTNGAITVFTPGSTKFSQNIRLRRSTFNRRSEPLQTDAELTFPVNSLDFILQRTRENFFYKSYHSKSDL